MKKQNFHIKASTVMDEIESSSASASNEIEEYRRIISLLRSLPSRKPQNGSEQRIIRNLTRTRIRSFPLHLSLISTAAALGILLILILQTRPSAEPDYTQIDLFLINSYTTIYEDKVENLFYEPDADRKFEVYETLYYHMSLIDPEVNTKLIDLHYDYLIHHLDQLI